MANFIGWSRSLTSKDSALIAFKHPCFDVCDGLPQLERLCGRVRREVAQVKHMPGGGNPGTSGGGEAAGLKGGPAEECRPFVG